MDYQVEISEPDGKWTRTFSEWSSAGSNRTLSEKDGVKDFFAKNGRYVLLSADLNAMGSPDKYRVVFYTEQKKGIYLASRFHTFGLHRKAGL
jgi:hypothetical protein